MPEQVDGPEAWLAHADHNLNARRLAEARDAFSRAEAAGADQDRCHAGRWMAAMLGGDFKAAWRETDAIRESGAPDVHRFWNGQDISRSKVIVRCLHGLGDAVQMLRYAGQLQAITSRTIYEVAPRMLPLARFFFGVDEAITWGDEAPRHAIEWDIQIEVMELPYVFRTTLADLPLATNYLRVPADLISAAALAMGIRKKPRVGIVWTSGDWAPERSVPLAVLQPISQTEEVEYWSLQGGSAAAEAPEQAIRNATLVSGDGVLALAATISNLDLVITTDTLAAHLSGAMGKPVWVMLNHAADWRWMTVRDDSPWYPSMRLFRQPVSGDWTTVVKALQTALRARTA